jgi:hypothetical protein
MAVNGECWRVVARDGGFVGVYSRVKTTHTHTVGCVIDGACYSADYINLETVLFAQAFGFDADIDSIELGDMSGDDRQELSDLADDALSFLNDLPGLPAYCSYMFEDNSLFLVPDIDGARESVEFASSREQDYPSDDYRGEWLHVNDHGNATLYVRGENGHDVEIWAVV